MAQFFISKIETEKRTKYIVVYYNDFGFSVPVYTAKSKQEALEYCKENGFKLDEKEN